MTDALWVVTVMMTVTALHFVLGPIGVRRFAWPNAGIAVAIFIPGVAIGLYGHLGTSDATIPVSSMPRSASRSMTNAQSTMPIRSVDSVSVLLDGLEQRLELEPNDASGWLLLAKSYRHLGRIEDARTAYASAVALGKEEAAFAQFLKVHPAVASTQQKVTDADLAEKE